MYCVNVSWVREASVPRMKMACKAWLPGMAWRRLERPSIRLVKCVYVTLEPPGLSGMPSVVPAG